MYFQVIIVTGIRQTLPHIRQTNTMAKCIEMNPLITESSPQTPYGTSDPENGTQEGNDSAANKCKEKKCKEKIICFCNGVFYFFCIITGLFFVRKKSAKQGMNLQEVYSFHIIYL